MFKMAMICLYFIHDNTTAIEHRSVAIVFFYFGTECQKNI